MQKLSNTEAGLKKAFLIKLIVYIYTFFLVVLFQRTFNYFCVFNFILLSENSIRPKLRFSILKQDGMNPF